MKFIGRKSDADCDFHDCIEVKDEEIKTIPPKELEGVVFEEGIDLVIYNIENQKQYVVAVEMEPGWYRRFIPERE